MRVDTTRYHSNRDAVNVDGRQVAQSALSQFCNLASVPAGMYVVQAQMKDGSKVSTKIVRK